MRERRWRREERDRGARDGGKESFILRFRMNPHKHLKQVVANCYNTDIKERKRERHMEGEGESLGNALSQKISSLRGI